VDTREKLRLRMARDVLRLVRVRDFRAAFPPLAEEGSAPIAIGFRDDTIKDVMDQINQLGGNAHLVVPPTDGDAWPYRMAIVQVQTSGRRLPPIQNAGDDCRVQPDSEIGMLLELLMLYGRPMTFHICRQETTVELVDDGKELVPG
jgi:hypothetical protein